MNIVVLFNQTFSVEDVPLILILLYYIVVVACAFLSSDRRVNILLVSPDFYIVFNYCKMVCGCIITVSHRSVYSTADLKKMYIYNICPIGPIFVLLGLLLYKIIFCNVITGQHCKTVDSQYVLPCISIF